MSSHITHFSIVHLFILIPDLPTTLWYISRVHKKNVSLASQTSTITRDQRLMDWFTDGMPADVQFELTQEVELLTHMGRTNTSSAKRGGLFYLFLC